MNQILTTKMTKPKSTTNIKSVKIFFAISIIIFGIFLVTSGSFAVYKSLNSNSNPGKLESQVIDNQNETNTVGGYTPVETEESEINIELETKDTSVLVKVNGNKEISFVTYKWDDEEETRENIGGMVGEITIEIPSAEHTLTVTAVDIENNSSTKTIQVKGVTRPKVEAKLEGSYIIITASDEIGLEKIEYFLNGQGYRYIANGIKEWEYKQQLAEGENTIEITAFNTEGYTEQFNAKCRN